MKASLQRLLFLNIVAFCLMSTLCIEPFRHYWEAIDRTSFIWLNTYCEAHPIQQIFWALANIRYTDLVGVILLIGFFCFYIFEVSHQERRQRVAQFLYSLLWFELAMTTIKQVITPYLMAHGWGRHGPSLIVEHCFRLSQVIPWLQVKDASAFSFPADHGFFALMWAVLIGFSTGCMRGFGAFCIAILFCLPRLISGAHWVSDIAVGSCSLVLFTYAWASYKPLHATIMNILYTIVRYDAQGPDNTLFQKILTHAKTIKTMESIFDLLSWDEETVMPKEGCAHRSTQKELLAGLIHTAKQDPEFCNSIMQLQESFPKNSDKAIIVHRFGEDITRDRKITTSFVQTWTATTSSAFTHWHLAKHQQDWSLFEPHLQRIVQLLQEKVDVLGYAEHPYDALLDLHDPGLLTRDVIHFFDELKPQLIPLVRNLPEIQEEPASSLSIQDQLSICRNIVAYIGYDWSQSRLDVSEHPFSTTIHAKDRRITIRNGSSLLDQILSALHEAGHSLYEGGLLQHYYGTPLAEAAFTSIHESQSRFWETIIGRSTDFAHHIVRIVQEATNNNSPFNEQTLNKLLFKIGRSPIRCQADEVTYPLHVLVRFEIEKALIEGSLRVQDVPNRWNESMKTYLGLTPQSDSLGCLQDVHWSHGLFGYFPTYTFGSLYAISLGQAIRKQLPFEELVRNGDFAPIHDWLKTNVWQHGRRYTSKELMVRIYGKEPSAQDYMSYILNKYIQA